MTALTQYERLESPGLWRASPDAQRRNVIVSVGDATLTISDARETALTHWSLPAVERLNPGIRPALFAPAPDSDEQLELDDEAMIRAIEKVRQAIARRRPHHGRLRQMLIAASIVLVAALALFWLPGALVSYTVNVVPAPTRAAVGQRLLTRIRRVAGQQCDDPLGRAALGRLATRVLGPGQAQLVVLTGGIGHAGHLPGGIILLNRALVEDYEEPDVVAGYVLAEAERIRQRDPVEKLLQAAGLVPTLRLLTTGKLPDTVLDDYAETLLTAAPDPLSDAALLARFAQAGLRSSPYAYAVDLTGESTLGLIEADPVPLGSTAPILSDGDWVSLQGICGE